VTDSQQLAKSLEGGKMMHVVTDGGAKLNPGKAGWGATIRQNEKSAYLYGDALRASNNTMELIAVCSLLHTLDLGMPVWVSTDSSHVNNAIVEWIHDEKRERWRTPQMSKVSNVTLWKESDEVTLQHRAAEFVCVTGHIGVLLNKCAEMLETRGQEGG
jgi:ribonuclease HI